MLFLGCDPDMHAMAFAWVDTQLKPVYIELTKIQASWKGTAAIVRMAEELADRKPFLAGQVCGFAVEGQDLTRRDDKGRKPNPYTILNLSAVAGSGISYCWARCGTKSEAKGKMPLAREWKGQVSKLAHHKRILHHAGITQFTEAGGEEGYCVVTDPLVVVDVYGGKLNPGDWKHIVDAIGLAQYAATCYLDSQRKQKYLTQARTPSPGVTT